jgi:hypothetical protein
MPKPDMIASRAMFQHAQKMVQNNDPGNDNLNFRVV